MCLICFGVDVFSGYHLVVGANRDEFYERPTAAMHFWPDTPDLLAGRDLRGGGTWMGITRSGRFSALTNYRDPSSLQPLAPSRGRLVTDYLLGKTDPLSYLKKLHIYAHRYNGFNLVTGDGKSVYWYGSPSGEIRRLGAGVYGLSNHLLDTPWPKVRMAKNGLSRLLPGEGELAPEPLFRLLADHTFPGREELPDTGVGPVKERMLSPLFIMSADYGTRSSTVLLWSRKGRVRVVERCFTPPRDGDGAAPPSRLSREYLFEIYPQ